MTTHQIKIGEGKPLAEKFATESIRHYFEASEHIKLRTKDKDTAGSVIKQFFADTGLRELKDGETGLVARLQDREGAGSFDFGSMSDQDIVLLARAGCFGAISKTALTAIGKANPRAEATAKKYMMPGGLTSALIVSDR